MEEIGAFLTRHGLRHGTASMHQNLVETVDDLLFLVKSQQDCAALGLAPDVAGALWGHLEPLLVQSAASKPSRNSLFSKKKGRASSPQPTSPIASTSVDLTQWLASCEATSIEPVLREKLVETVDDLVFLSGGTQAGLAAVLGVAGPQLERMWNHLVSSAPDDCDATPALDSSTLALDIATWLDEVGAPPGCETPLRAALVETVEDLGFIVSNCGAAHGLEQLGLSPSQAVFLAPYVQAAAIAFCRSDGDAGTNSEQHLPKLWPRRTPPPSPAAKMALKTVPKKFSPPDAATLALDVGVWLRQCKVTDCEMSLRQNLIESVQDLCFLVSSREDLVGIGFNSVNTSKLWPHVEKLVGPADTKRALQPQSKHFLAKKTESHRRGSPAPAPAPAPKPRKTASKERTTAKGPSRQSQELSRPKKHAATKEVAVSKRTPRVISSEVHARLTATKSRPAADTPPKKAPPRKIDSQAIARLTAPLRKSVTEPEPPQKRKGKVRALPRVAQLPMMKKKGVEGNEDLDGTTSPRLEWEQQQRLLDKLEAEQRRKEEIEWRKQLAAQREAEAAAERLELQRMHQQELTGLQNVTARLTEGSDGVPPSRTRSKKAVTDGSMELFVQRMHADAEGRRERLKLKQEQSKIDEVAMLKDTPEISRGSKKLAPASSREVSVEARLARLSSPQRDVAAERRRAAFAAEERLLTSPPRKVISPRAEAEFLSRVEEDARRRRERQQRARRYGDTDANRNSTFRPSINRNPRGVDGLRSPERTGSKGPRVDRQAKLAGPASIARLIMDVKANMQDSWDNAGGVDPDQIFDYYDKDKDGRLSFAEWSRAVKRDGTVGGWPVLSDTELAEIFYFVDADSDGAISLREFHAFLQGKSLQRTSSLSGTKLGKAKRTKSRRKGKMPGSLDRATNSGAPAPPAPPSSLQSASVDLIDHCAQYVAKHGESFEGILKTRNFGQPGWEFLFADESAESTRYYRSRLQYEMERLVHATADRAEQMYTETVAIQAADTSLQRKVHEGDNSSPNSYPKHSLT